MLGVSRTAVWKNIQKLKEEGYPIEAVTNKGYRLLSVDEADILDREQIAAKLTTVWAGRPLIYKEETGSSNDDIFVLAAQGYPHGTLVVTSRQTAGKGRRGRTWISPKEGNVYMSILLKPDLPAEVTPMLTVVMALSVYQASLDMTAAQPQESAARCRFGIKWPNDIVVSVDDGPYRKLCGILTEMRMEDREISAITIGIGLNVNQDVFLSDAPNPVSMRQILGREFNRDEVLRRILAKLNVCRCMVDFTYMRYNAMLYRRGKGFFTFHDASGDFMAEILETDRSGLLMLRKQGGEVQSYAFKEVQFII